MGRLVPYRTFLVQKNKKCSDKRTYLRAEKVSIGVAGIVPALICLLGLLPVLLFGSVVTSVSAPLDTVLLERKCTDCHDLDVIFEKKSYTAEWQKIVDRMAAYDSSEISQIDKLMVLKYIKENLALDGPGGRAKRKK